MKRLYSLLVAISIAASLFFLASTAYAADPPPDPQCALTADFLHVKAGTTISLGWVTNRPKDKTVELTINHGIGMVLNDTRSDGTVPTIPFRMLVNTEFRGKVVDHNNFSPAHENQCGLTVIVDDLPPPFCILTAVPMDIFPGDSTTLMLRTNREGDDTIVTQSNIPDSVLGPITPEVQHVITPPGSRDYVVQVTDNRNFSPAHSYLCTVRIRMWSRF